MSRSEKPTLDVHCRNLGLRVCDGWQAEQGSERLAHVWLGGDAAGEAGGLVDGSVRAFRLTQ